MSKNLRPQIFAYITASIDGYIAHLNGNLDWLYRVGGFNEDYGYHKLISSIDAVILGRKTYEVAATAPDPYPKKRVIVLSNSLTSVKAGMELYRGDLAELRASWDKSFVQQLLWFLKIPRSKCKG